MTESEIRQGVLRSSNPAMQCCWFGRNIRDLYQHTNDDHAQWFIDITSGSSTIDNEAQDLLGQLKDGIMSEKLPPSNIKTYDIEWHQVWRQTNRQTDRQSPKQGALHFFLFVSYIDIKARIVV